MPCHHPLTQSLNNKNARPKRKALSSTSVSLSEIIKSHRKKEKFFDYACISSSSSHAWHKVLCIISPRTIRNGEKRSKSMHIKCPQGLFWPLGCKGWGGNCKGFSARSMHLVNGKCFCKANNNSQERLKNSYIVYWQEEVKKFFYGPKLTKCVVPDIFYEICWEFRPEQVSIKSKCQNCFKPDFLFSISWDRTERNTGQWTLAVKIEYFSGLTDQRRDATSCQKAKKRLVNIFLRTKTVCCR